MDPDVRPLKQPAVSLWPGSYGEREGSQPVSWFGLAIYDVFLLPTYTLLRFSSIPFFSRFLGGSRTCAHTPIPGYRSPPMMADSASAPPPSRAYLRVHIRPRVRARDAGVARDACRNACYSVYRSRFFFTLFNFFDLRTSRSTVHSRTLNEKCPESTKHFDFTMKREE